MSRLRIFFGSVVILVTLPALAEPPASAATQAGAAAASTTRQARSGPAMPFGFELGKTTVDTAEQHWQSAGARLVGRGHAAIGAGSGRDGLASLSVDKILLVDIADTEFEVTRTARFAFYDGVLYSIQVKLADLLANGKEAEEQLDARAIAALETDLRRKYGAPTRAMSDMFAKKKPNLLIWEFGPNHLALYTGGLRPATLGLTNQPLRDQAERYKKAECNKSVGCSGNKKP